MSKMLISVFPDPVLSAAMIFSARIRLNNKTQSLDQTYLYVLVETLLPGNGRV